MKYYYNKQNSGGTFYWENMLYNDCSLLTTYVSGKCLKSTQGLSSVVQKHVHSFLPKAIDFALTQGVNLSQLFY